MEAFEPVPVQHLNPNRPKPSLQQKLALVFRVLGTSLATVLINIFLYVAKLLHPFLGRKTYRRICDFVQHAWFDTAFLLLSRTRMHIYGHNKNIHCDDNDKRPRIVIANHATDVDWFYLWMIAHTCELPRSGHVKVMLKEGIKRIPLYGWLLDNLDFLWMKREWESDRGAISKKIEKLCSDDEHLWLVMFPEGMTINTKSMGKSQEFARNANRPHLEMTLLPRDKGLTAVLDMTKHLNPEIIDVTMAFESFSGEIPTWEMGYERNNDHLIPNAKKLMAGMSGDVFMDVQIFETADVLNHPEGVQGWLDERWVRKDTFLKHFARDESFPIEKDQVEIKIPQGSLNRLCLITMADLMIGYVVRRVVIEGWKRCRLALQ
jgi:1-acyl-sn-glycerol-3-phosphate acyltransferase